MSVKIYKICLIQEWQSAYITGIYKGSRVDLEDGFIHFSTQQQLIATARKHFHGQKNLILVEFNTKNLSLTWEPSRGGALFPHLYQELSITGSETTWALTLDENNIPVLPF